MDINVNELEELNRLRWIVGTLVGSSGRLTSDESHSLDYAWDMAEEWAEGNPDFFHPRTRLYFECHISLEPVEPEFDEMLKSVAHAFGFRVAKFLMKKADSLEPDDFLTTRGREYADVEQRMNDCVFILEQMGFIVKRSKIEDTLYDTKWADDHG